MGLVLAFDTATHVATVAVLDGDSVVGERITQAHRVLEAAHETLAAAGAGPADIAALVVGTGPGSFTGLRLGLAAAQGFALARDVPAAGVCTLEALAAGSPGALPVVDGGRREVFTLLEGEPVSLAPGDVPAGPGTTCVGDGAVRYRSALEALGADVPPDAADTHVPHARHHARLARERGSFGLASSITPVYVREPDAKAPA